MNFLLYDPLYDKIYKRFDINEKTDCWEWNASRTKDDYATISYQGKTILVHRKMYELRWGPIPAGYEVDHKCRNRCCICPSHLRLTTVQMNRALRSDLIPLRDERLRILVRHYKRDLLYPGPILASTELAALWQCQSCSVTGILATMALIYPGFYCHNLQPGNHGPKPSRFQIWLASSIIEDVNSVCDIRKFTRGDVL
jgi:hypothetical protein